MRVRHRRHRCEARLQIGDDGIRHDMVGRLVVDVQGDRGVERLRRRLERATECIRAAHLLDQLHRNRVTRLVMLGEGLEHLRIPHPLLEHLGRGLDEIAFRRRARHRLPLPLTAEDRVEQVPELVEEGLDVGVLHQSRIPRLPAREIADERVLRKLEPPGTLADRELCGVVEFSRPRMEIEVEPAEEPRAFVHLVRFDRRIPDGRVRDPLVGDPEHPGGHVQHALLHVVEREVGPHFLRIEIEITFPDEPAVVGDLPPVHLRGGGIVLLLSLEIDGVFLLRALQGRLVQARDEIGGVLGRADHLVFRDVVGPGRVAQDARHAIALRQERIEHREVRRVGAVHRFVHDLLPEVRALGVADHGNVVGGLDAEGDRPVGAGRVSADVVLGEPLEVRGSDLDPT